MFLLCLIDFFSKYGWVFPLKGKKEVTLNAFPKIFRQFSRGAYDFSVDYNAVAVNDILDIYKYLMKKPSIKIIWIY